MAYNIEDYIEVKDRIEKLYQDYPNASIQTEIIELTDKRVTVKASVYTNPEDPIPTTGHSYMNIPGTTNYTRGSELENAETSAVGRAIALMGYEVKKSIASRDEVASKQVEEGYEPAAKVSPKSYPTTLSEDQATDKQMALVLGRATERFNNDQATAKTQLNGFCKVTFGYEGYDELKKRDVDTVLEWLKTGTN